jgi:hypothetical protein
VYSPFPVPFPFVFYLPQLEHIDMTDKQPISARPRTPSSTSFVLTPSHTPDGHCDGLETPSSGSCFTMHNQLEYFERFGYPGDSKPVSQVLSPSTLNKGDVKDANIEVRLIDSYRKTYLLSLGQTPPTTTRKRGFDLLHMEGSPTKEDKSGSKPVKRRRRSYSPFPTDSGLGDDVSVRAMQQEYLRRSSFEARMAMLIVRDLAEMRAICREIASIIREQR